MAKKEKYFSPENIDIKAREMLKKAKDISGRTNKQEFTPQNSALLVIDMQKYFCDETSHAFIPSAEAIIPRIKLLANTFKANNLPVIYTRHINTQENAGMMGKWWKGILSEGNNMDEIIPELNTKISHIIEKTQYDAFYNTNLESFLRENNTNQLVITGVMTHLCCETTARSAFVRGFKTFLCIDATATYNENFHTSSMINLSHGFSELILSHEIYSKLKEPAANEA